MFDIGWSELLLIGIVALIVVGPRDLPGMFHQLGRITAKARSMAREFSRAMKDAARESGLEDAAGSVRDLKSLASKKSLGLDTLEKAADRFEKWEPKAPDRKDEVRPEPATAPSRPDAASSDAASTGDMPRKAVSKKPATKKPAAKKATKKAARAPKTAAKAAGGKRPAKKSASKKDEA